MSWSSGRSQAPSFRRASGRRGDESRLPVPYRESPMAYEPEKLCWCTSRRKAPRWISWRRQNTGRRYYACVDAMMTLQLWLCLKLIEEERWWLCLWKDQLKEKNAEIDALKGKYQNVVFLFLVFVVGLVIAKRLLQ
ncbi:hypothetical protein VPH35_140713 [Triticum aestivum]